MKKRKPCIILVCVLALVLAGGCAGLQQGGQNVEEWICNPPENVVALVNQGEPFLVALLATLVPGSAAYVQAFEAFGGMTAVQAGVCATVKQVNALIEVLSGLQAKGFQAKAKAPALDVQVLKDWLAKAKK